MKENEVVAAIALLYKYEVPLMTWGKRGTKTLDHLLGELRKNECELKASTLGKLTRKIRVLSIRVMYCDPETQQRFYLVEEKQVFKDGRTRTRNLECSVAEKLILEEIADCRTIGNALQEELGISGEVHRLLYTDHYTTLGSSKSYPGLETMTEIFEATVYLTPDQYIPEGYIEFQSDKTNYFVWEKI
jgi:hypothetical protein